MVSGLNFVEFMFPFVGLVCFGFGFFRTKPANHTNHTNKNTKKKLG